MLFCEDIGTNRRPLSTLCHVVYATKGSIRAHLYNDSVVRVKDSQI
jgi:hypothetical protein